MSGPCRSCTSYKASWCWAAIPPAPITAQRFDLSLYEAFDTGVSRLHASLRRQETGEVEVLDLGSTNGTWLNGERLAPYLAAQVNSGDDLRLSRLWLTVYFVSAQAHLSKHLSFVDTVPGVLIRSQQRSAGWSRVCQQKIGG